MSVLQKGSTVAKGRVFENHVANLFDLLGYNVLKRDEWVAGRQIDLIIEDQSGPLSRQYIVECKDPATPIRVDDFDSFSAKLNAVKHALNPRVRGIMVARGGFTKAVKANALHSDMELIQISDLEKSIINLRDYTHVISLKQIILDMLDTYSIKAASYAAFEYLTRDGQILLILDGFDELVSRGNYEVTLRHFRELNKNALSKTKIILSSRTHYFTTSQDIHHLLQGTSSDKMG